MYNEILVIYGCGMEVDTVREVTIRAGKEYEQFFKKDNGKNEIQTLLVPTNID